MKKKASVPTMQFPNNKHSIFLKSDKLKIFSVQTDGAKLCLAGEASVRGRGASAIVSTAVAAVVFGVQVISIRGDNLRLAAGARPISAAAPFSERCRLGWPVIGSSARFNRFIAYLGRPIGSVVGDAARLNGLRHISPAAGIRR